MIVPRIRYVFVFSKPTGCPQNNLLDAVTPKSGVEFDTEIQYHSLFYMKCSWLFSLKVHLRDGRAAIQ